MKNQLKILAVIAGLLGFLGMPSAAPEGETGDNTVTMNFVGADIESVIKAIGQYTNTTFIIDPRVNGTITLVADKPLGKAQAFAMLASTLRLQGYALVHGNGFVKVVPEADAKLQLPGTTPPSVKGDQIATRIFQLSYESATNLLPVLRPLISPNNTINVNPGNNTLVVTDYAENLQRIAKMIATLDVPAISDMEVIPIQYAFASDIAVMVEKLLDMGAPAGGNESQRTVILADIRTNSVIIRAPSTGRTNLARSLIAKLDQPTRQAGNVYVVYLKNADAVKLAQTLRSMVSFDTSAPASPTAGTLAQAGSLLESMATKTAPGQSGVQSKVDPQSSQLQQASGGGGGSGNRNGGFIQADPTTNTLIITASEPVYRNLRSVIDQLDTARAQVYVEALIVEVTDSLVEKLGVQWVGADQISNNTRIGGITRFGPDDTVLNRILGNTNPGHPSSKKIAPPSGMSVGILHRVAGEIGLGALATALEGQDGGNVLSMPNLLTLDNEEARIIVGQNVPIVTGSYLPPTGTSQANPFQTIERKDVGVALRVRPRISEGGTVRLEISQEVSSVDPSTASNRQGPTMNKRSLDTNVVMDDGAVIVLGGLIGDSKSNSTEKVPLLGDIPGLGVLFTYQETTREKTNLMIFLKPTIIRSSQRSGSIAMDRYDYIRRGQSQLDQRRALLKDQPSVLPALPDGGPFMKLPQQPPAEEKQP